MARNSTRLQRADCFKIASWLRDNWEMLKQEKFKWPLLIEKIKNGTQVNVDISAGTVGRLAEDAGLNIDDIKPIRKVIRSAKGTNTRKLANQIRATQLQLKSLCYQLDVPFNEDGKMDPEWLRVYANGLTNKEKDD